MEGEASDVQALGELGSLLKTFVMSRRECEQYAISPDTPQEVKQLLRLAKQHHEVVGNDGTATWTLGAIAAETGDPSLAQFLFQRVADGQPETSLIHLNARYRLGTLLFDNDSDADTKGGLEHIMWVAGADPAAFRAAQEGDGMLDALQVVVAAQYNIGCAYFDGIGVARSVSEAVAWWMKAACDGQEEGSADAMHRLGDYYSKPVLVDLRDPLVYTEQDFVEAVSWYQCAQKQGHIPSICDLGLLYRDGKGCRKDQVEALKLLREAGDAGHDVAEAALAEHYYKMGLYNKSVQWALRVVEPFLGGGSDDVYTGSYDDVDSADLKKWRARACWYLAQCVKEDVGRSSLPNPQPWTSYFQLAKDMSETTVTELEKMRVLHKH